jgi:hypothetical protein
MNTRGKYWLIPIDDRMFKSMRDINVDMELILNLRKTQGFLKVMYNDGYMYMALSNGEWKYTATDNKYDGNLAYNHWGYTYMGTVNIDDMEFNVKKYNI